MNARSSFEYVLGTDLLGRVAALSPELPLRSFDAIHLAAA